MSYFLAFCGLLGLVVFGWGLVSIQSDIQIIIALIGLFSAVILFGMVEVLERISRLSRALKDSVQPN